MKKSSFLWRAVLLLSLIIPGTMGAQSCPAPPVVNQAELLGEWKGSFTYNNEILPLNLLVRENGEQMEAVTAISALNIPKSNLDAWLCQSNELHMRVDLPDQRVLKLIGTPENGKIVGRLIYHDKEGAMETKEVFTMALIK